MKQEWERILRQTEAYYTAKVSDYGPTAQGVDWNSSESQQLRYKQVLRLIEDKREPFSINDFGCGYGALVDYLQTQGYAFSYQGFDLSPEMIRHAQKRYGHLANCSFCTVPETVTPAQYTVASGIFNVKLDIDADIWTAYLLAVLDQLSALSTHGFAFNVLTQYSDPPHMQPHLYYAAPHFLLQHCQQRYSPWVTLLHDYGLYEFTLLIRKEKNC